MEKQIEEKQTSEKQKLVGDGSIESPWVLKTPSGGAEYTLYKDKESDPPSLVCQVGKTKLSYELRCIEDFHEMLKTRGDWVPLGIADEGKPTVKGTVEDWARSPRNPVGGFYGLKKGLRGRFAMYIPPLMEGLGLAELEHNPKNNRVKAK